MMKETLVSICALLNKHQVKASEILELEGVKIPVIGYNHLIQTKLLTNRLKDKADAEELAKRKKGHAGQ